MSQKAQPLASLSQAEGEIRELASAIHGLLVLVGDHLEILEARKMAEELAADWGIPPKEATARGGRSGARRRRGLRERPADAAARDSGALFSPGG